MFTPSPGHGFPSVSSDRWYRNHYSLRLPERVTRFLKHVSEEHHERDDDEISAIM